MLRHFDLKSSNKISKPSISKSFLKGRTQEKQHGKDVKTSKTQSLHNFNDSNDIPRAKLNSEPTVCQNNSYIVNRDTNLKKFRTLVNLKSGDRKFSFYPTPTLIDESIEYQTCKIVPNKERKTDYIYKVVFQSTSSKRLDVQ